MPAGKNGLRPRSLDAILAFWAQELGVNAAELMVAPQGVEMTANSSIPGILLFRRGKHLRIAASAPKLNRIHSALVGETFGKVLTTKFWDRFPDLLGTPVGPALLFYLDSVPAKWSAALPRTITVRGLSPVDAKGFAELSSTLTEAERQECGLEFGPRPLWGVFRVKTLIAVAGYDPWPGRIAHVGVAVHPEHRRKGFGQIAVQAATRGALARRRIVQYRTLDSNEASAGIAKALAFLPFAETLYIRPPVAT
jgi:RimJ/RimL family protein N-acetyltransferase